MERRSITCAVQATLQPPIRLAAAEAGRDEGTVAALFPPSTWSEHAHRWTVMPCARPRLTHTRPTTPPPRFLNAETLSDPRSGRTNQQHERSNSAGHSRICQEHMQRTHCNSMIARGSKRSRIRDAKEVSSRAIFRSISSAIHVDESKSIFSNVVR